MLSPTAPERPAQLVARSLGPIAARVLRVGAVGVIVAVFERSLYARVNGQIVCVGPGLPDGPLNAVCEPRGRSLLGTLAAETTLDISQHRGPITSGVSLDVSECPVWEPPPIGPVKPSVLRKSLASLTDALPPPPAEGLAGLLLPNARQSPSSVIQSAMRAAQHLSAAIGQGAPAHPGAMRGLIGLGPGLTPSGDDYLCGLLVALKAVGEHRRATTIWRAIAPHIGELTTAISAAYLAAAAEGLGSAPLHALIAELSAGELRGLDEKVAAVTAIGHTSGWDGLAGAVHALQAFADDDHCAAST